MGFFFVEGGERQRMRELNDKRVSLAELQRFIAEVFKSFNMISLILLKT